MSAFRVEASVAVRAEGGAGRAHRTGGGRLEAVPFRRKLDILVAAPLAGVLLALIPLSWTQFDAARNWTAAAQAMARAEQITMLINALETEQTIALGLQGMSAVPGSASSVSAALTQMRTAAARTDQAAAQLNAQVGPQPGSSLSQALSEEKWLATLPNGARAVAMHPSVGNSGLVQTSYDTAINDLYSAIGMDALAANGGTAAFDEAELDFLYMTDLTEHEREIGLLAMTDNADQAQQAGQLQQGTGADAASLDWADLSIVEREYGFSQNEGARFQGLATGTDASLYDQVVGADDAQYIDGVERDMESLLSHSDPGFNVDEVLLTDQFGDSGSLGLWQASVAVARDRAQMEAQVSTDVVASARHEAHLEEWYAAGLLAAAALMLLLLVVLEIRVRRSLVLPMLRLTRAARQIADVTRADLERVADEDDGGEPGAAPVFETIPALSRDELGDLAEAFNRVQDTASRVLERQMAVRHNTAEMFGNVGRRIHNLTGRQLSLIDAAEREETDPSVLERLYRIDHLAVRLQRGADSLMLLSGETEPGLADAPLRLTDVVRSAVGRVEGYQRVVLSAEGDVTVSPAAVGDLTLIVAELVENAVSFSPATSSVDIAVRPVGATAVVEIVDHGVGMTAARLAEENARLVRRERLDLAPSKVLGLFVVGRLARRSGIGVRLNATSGGGVTVRLDIGPDLLAFDAPEPPLRRRGPTRGAPPVAPALPEQRATAEQNASVATQELRAPDVRREPEAEPGVLPVRRPRPAPDDAPVPAVVPELLPRRRTAQLPASAEGSAPDAVLTALPRRTRANAALRDEPAPSASAATAPAHVLDAEAARAAVEEFEAGVEEALRVSAQNLSPLRASDEPEGLRP
ncbi:HAMP domain-containing protein [Actinospica durhamensis]|uniref:histidine kinase n=1 Tax=Actinospica durhamensis TaxID=1508375 RepID=A0A941EV69_9ACTN|nr:ATP-binding protein [Actinospica durhamensis]MBR7837871.1 HAMP domain-containing protein [Actinospica durhamensis]